LSAKYKNYLSLNRFGLVTKRKNKTKKGGEEEERTQMMFKM